MTISIITVCFNSASTIRDTFDSVLNQTYQDYEYVVVDGNSQDETISIINEYEHKFNGKIKWISETDKGLYDAMNKGIQMASGDVIGILNSDDLFFDANVLEKIVEKFSYDTNTDAVYANLYYVSKRDTSKIIRHWITGKKRPFRTGWHPAHPAFYIKKRIYEKYGYFNSDYKLAADFEIMLRFIDKYKIKLLYLEDNLVRMRLGGETNKTLKNIFLQNLECLKAFHMNQIPVNYLMYPLKRLMPKLLQYKK